MEFKTYYCPICDFKLIKTDFFNTIFEDYNYYCPQCNSYHIFNKIDDRAFYTKEYHKDFKYEIGKFKYMAIKLLPFLAHRSISKLKFLNKYVNLEQPINIMEIGAATGENFIIFEKKITIRKYLIVEPGSIMHIGHPNVVHLKNTFEDVDLTEVKDSNLIIMFHVLEYIYDLDSFFKKIERVDFDYFYLEVPNISIEDVKRDSLLNNPHYHHFSKHSLRLLLEKYCFEEVVVKEIEPISYHPYKKISPLKKYLYRALDINEQFNPDKGIYLRGIFKKNKQN